MLIFCFEAVAVLVAQQVLAVRVLIIPVLIKRQELICNRNFSDSIFCLTFDYFKILLVQIHMFFFQIKDDFILQG